MLERIPGKFNMSWICDLFKFYLINFNSNLYIFFQIATFENCSHNCFNVIKILYVLVTSNHHTSFFCFELCILTLFGIYFFCIWICEFQHLSNLSFSCELVNYKFCKILNCFDLICRFRKHVVDGKKIQFVFKIILVK